MNDSLYLDVAVVRIGEYLGRWPSLRGLRGASIMIRQACAPERIRPVLAPLGAEVHEEVGQVDGVARVRAPAETDPLALVEVVTNALREDLPGAAFDAVWSTGARYGDAYRSGLGPNRRPDCSLSVLHPLNEVPFGARCELTGADLATGTVQLAGNEPHRNRTPKAGVDGHRRDRAAERRTQLAGGAAAGLALEYDLADAIGLDTVQDFDELAALVAETDFKANHLATVYVDGDQIGALIEQVATDDARRRDQDDSPTKLSTVSKGLKVATWEALVSATARVAERLQATKLPVIPHIGGGDDVVVSVPAALVWVFVRTYLAEFEQKASAIGGRAVTASAGVVIANVATPFNDCFVWCDELQADAKRRLDVSSVLWLDLTRDGPTPPVTRTPWSLAEVEANADLLKELSDMGKSRRHELGEALDAASPHLAEVSVRQLARRHGDPHDRRGQNSRMPSWASTDPDTVRSALSIADWWWVA